MNKINILAISAGNTGGVAYHRIMIPFNYLMKHSSDSFNIVYAPDEAIILDAPNLANIDIVHFHANITYNTPLMDKLFEMQKRGCKLVMDMDDYPIIPKWNPAYKGYMSKLHKPITSTINKVDAITTTTKLFANEIKKSFKGPITVLPNVIDRNFEQFQPVIKKSERLRIGLVGGSSHFKDIELLSEMAKELKPYKDYIQFVLCGFNVENTNPEFNPWNDVERILTDDYSTISEYYKDYLFRYDKDEYPNVANEPYRRIWAKDINAYGTAYNEIDILLAPLQNEKFNQMKSELKVVEAGNFGKVFIGSSVGQYKEVITNGYDGLLINTSDKSGWANAIKKILKNPEIYLILSNNLQKLVYTKYSISKQNDKRVEFYKKLTNGKR